MLLHKLRRAMVAPKREPLKGEIEADEFFLGGFEEGLTGGRRREKTLVGVAVEVRGRGSGRLRLQVLADASGGSLGAFVSSTTAQGRSCTLTPGRATAGWRSLATTIDHAASGPSPASTCCRAHRAVSNLKAWLHGTHHWASPEHTPAYLNEFVFRHNRRGTPHDALQTLLGLSARHAPATYRQIIDRTAWQSDGTKRVCTSAGSCRTRHDCNRRRCAIDAGNRGEPPAGDHGQRAIAGKVPAGIA